MPVTPPHRVVVTGGRGRLATLVADHFRAPGLAVELRSRTPGPGFSALEDLLRPGQLAGAAAVLHLAWSTLPATSELHPGVEAEVDLPLLGRLLDALAAVGPARPLFVFFSTGGAVYGNAPGRPSREDDACQPIGRYGRAKLAAERLILERATRDDLPCAVLRVSNPYGYPVPKDRLQGLVPHALRCAMEGQPLEVWGDGSARKDFLYYTDFIAAVEAVVSRRLRGTFNVAGGESHSVSEVLAAVEAETGRRIPRVFRPAPSWDVRDSRLDIGRFAAAADWSPRVGLTEGIRRAAAGYALH